MGLTREEISARQGVGAHIGRIRRVARKFGMDPDDVIYCKKVDGEKRWFPGKLLLKNELPPLPPEEQRLLDERMMEMECRELIEGYARQEGLSVEEVEDKILAVVAWRLASEIREVLEA